MQNLQRSLVLPRTFERSNRHTPKSLLGHSIVLQCNPCMSSLFCQNLQRSLVLEGTCRGSKLYTDYDRSNYSTTLKCTQCIVYRHYFPTDTLPLVDKQGGLRIVNRQLNYSRIDLRHRKLRNQENWDRDLFVHSRYCTAGTKMSQKVMNDSQGTPRTQ